MKFNESKQYKTLLPFFLLALAVMGAYKLLGELGAILEFFGRLWGIITPFFAGFVLAYILNIPCGGILKLMGKSKSKFIAKRKKAFSIIFVYILFALVLFLILNLIIPSIYSSVEFFAANFQTYYNSAQSAIGLFNEWGEYWGLHISMDELFAMVPAMSLESLAAPFEALFGVSTAIFRSFLAFISSIYILFEKDKFKAGLNRLLRVFTSGNAYTAIHKYTGMLNHNFRQYIYTQTLDGVILGTIVTIELYLLGSPFFLVLGIILGIVNYIPYFGSIVGTLVAIVIVAFTQGLTMALIAAAVLLVTQQIDGNVIQPKLMGGSFSISPLLIIVSVTIGGALAGVFGMIAAIPIVVVLKDILGDIISYYEKRKENA